MSNIKISNLHPTGSELFTDSESYMAELADSELDIINGGVWTTPVVSRVTNRIVTRQISRYLTRTTPYRP